MDVTVLAQSGKRFVIHFLCPAAIAPHPPAHDSKEHILSPSAAGTELDDPDTFKASSVHASSQVDANALATQLTVADVKDRLMQAWPDGFADRPSDASFIRLIHFGKVLDDSQALATLLASRPGDPPGTSSDSPGLPQSLTIHISVRPASALLTSMHSKTGSITRRVSRGYQQMRNGSVHRMGWATRLARMADKLAHVDAA